jgi:hypothetical protein
MIGKMDPRDRVCLSIRAKDECVQQDFYARLGADFVERALDAFGIENDKDAAMPDGRRVTAPQRLSLVRTSAATPATACRGASASV